MRITAILMILWAFISVVHGQERSNIDREPEGQGSGSQQEGSGASMSLFDAAGKAHRIYQDWNATPRTTDFLLQNATGSEESVSAASSVVFLPQLTGTVWNGAAQEMDAVLFFPKIIRPSKGTPAPTISGVAIAAPIDGGGTVPALDAATLRIESNPPLAMGAKSWALAVDAGDVKIGNHIYFPQPSGVQQGRGDMIFNNLDASAAGTISFYSGGALRMRMQPSGLLAVPHGLSVGGNGTAIEGIYRASQKLAYSTIAAQSCAEREMEVANARPSGTAMASPGEPLGSGNLVWSAWISENDKVKVRVCNPTTSSITPNSVGWNVTVMQ
ncbi:MAG TPA: hypothetical protein VLA42_05115 [Verrucomicrobiae bacterium]|nr:hypothetical protein [Verrucomicrobiae bacterium]